MYFLIAFAVALVMCAVGYKKFVWFISIGYGFAVAGIGVAMFVMFWKSLEVVTVILSLLCIVYGLRLGLYLLRRELKSKSYQNTMKTERFMLKTHTRHRKNGSIVSETLSLCNTKSVNY